MKIYIDPRARLVYASLYIYGLSLVYGKNNVRFSMRYFLDLVQENGLDDFDHYFAFVIVDNNKIIKRIVIDYRDKNTINKVALNWCDSYGKVNFNSKTVEFNQLPGYLKNKTIPIGPNFGIKIWNVFVTVFQLFTNYFKGGKMLPVSFRSFFAGYNWQIKRLPFNNYLKTESEMNYIFFISSLYPENVNNISNTNRYRVSFIRTCKMISVNFEGGMLIYQNHQNNSNYRDVIAEQYIKPKDYIKKIKKSTIVFNTPAIWGCHGWKLGEYLALGKAIISTPLINEMPVPLIHGKHVHFVDSESEIESAVSNILSNSEYRRQLENGAKAYFEDHLNPTVVIKKLINL